MLLKIKKEIFTRLLKYVFDRPWLGTWFVFLLADWIIRYLIAPIRYISWNYVQSAGFSLLFWYSICLLHRWFSRPIRILFAALLAVLISLTITANIISFRELQHLLSPEMVWYVSKDIRHFWSYCKSYLLTSQGLLFIAIGLALFHLWYPKRTDLTRKITASAVCVVLMLTMVNIGFFQHMASDASFTHCQLIMDTRTILTMEKSFQMDPASLYPSRRYAIQSLPSLPSSAFNVVVILNESWGKKYLPFYGSDSSEMPFLTQWIVKEKDQFFIFPHAFSNASSTNVSMPSILTGVASHDDDDMLQQMPFLWQWGAAAGLKTVLVAAYDFLWSNFDLFFLSSWTKPDIYFTARDMKAPFVNDLGVDELLAVQYFTRSIQAIPANQHFFAVYISNALHAPFQQTSVCMKNQPRSRSPYCNSLTILDEGIKQIVATLEEKHLLDDTIFIMTSDHGDSDVKEHAIPRIYSYYDEIMSIPLLIRIPKAVMTGFPGLEQTLRANLSYNICNLDILPTLVDLLRLSKLPQNRALLLRLKGRSLVAPIPSDMAIVALNTKKDVGNVHKGFGLYWSSKRFVYSDLEGVQYFDVERDPGEVKNIWDNVLPAERNFVEKIIESNKYLKRLYALRHQWTSEHLRDTCPNRKTH